MLWPLGRVTCFGDACFATEPETTPGDALTPSSLMLQWFRKLLNVSCLWWPRRERGRKNGGTDGRKERTKQRQPATNAPKKWLGATQQSIEHWSLMTRSLSSLKITSARHNWGAPCNAFFANRVKCVGALSISHCGHLLTLGKLAIS